MKNKPDTIQSVHATRTRDTFLELAERARNGEIIGAALVLIHPDKKLEFGLTGYLKQAPRTASFGAAKFAAMLQDNDDDYY